MMLPVVFLLTSGLTGSGGVTVRSVVQLRGAGASFPKAVYSDWINFYRSRRHDLVDVNMTYDDRGSTYGKEAMMGRHDVELEYADSDYALSSKEKEDHPDLKLLPTMAGAVVFGYNLGDGHNQTLVLSMELVVGIYNGTYRYWNDSALKTLNSEMVFPNERIIVIARGDSSGTTHTVTTAFSTIKGWKDQYGAFAKGDSWDRHVVTYLAKTNRGMSGLILSFANSIGYLVVADALEARLKYAKMANMYGVVVSPTRESVQLAMDMAARVMTTDLTVELAHHQQRESYPIASFTYMIVRMSTMKNCVSARELLRYINWFSNDSFAMKACVDKNMVPISSRIRNRIEQLVLYHLECKGHVLWPSILEEIEEQKKQNTEMWVLPTIVAFTMIAILCLALGSYALVIHIRKSRALDSNDWDIPIEDIIFYSTAKSSTGNCRFVMWSSVRSLTEIDDLEDGYQMVKHILQWPGKWNSKNVGLRLLEIKDLMKVRKATKILLVSMRDTIIHNNVLNFYGLTELQDDRYVVSDYCSKGPLSDLLKDRKHLFNKDCKFSLTLEIISGLVFLHSKGIIHGNLRTSSCLVDFKWTVKIADWEYCHLYTHLNPKKNPLLLVRKTADEVGREKAAVLDFWTAPELLRPGNSVHPTVACDIYSFSIILQEIFTREEPYQEYLDTMEPSELLKAILGNNLRPSHSDETPMSIRQILEYAWSEIPSSRPSSEQILKMLRNAHNIKKSVLDHMVEASEEYTLSLEEQLRYKAELLSEKESIVASYTDLTMPSYLQKRLNDAEGGTNIDMTSSACILALCVVNKQKHNDRKRRNSSLIGNWLEQVDSRLTQIAAHYEAFLINYTSGVYIIIYGAGLKEKRKAIQAARMTFEVLSDPDSIPTATSSKESLVELKPTFKCAMHYGSVFTSIVNGPVPKCHIVGDAIQETYRLLQHGKPSKVLITKAYRDALTIVALDYFKLEVNDDHVKENGYLWSGETFWLHRRPNTDYPKWTRLTSDQRGRRESSTEDLMSLGHQRARRESSTEDLMSLGHQRGRRKSSTEDLMPLGHQRGRRESAEDLMSLGQPSRTKTRSRSSTTEEELPVARITSLLRKKAPPSRSSAHTKLTASASLPLGQQGPSSFNPWVSISGKLNRSMSFTTGTIASLRHFLRRTLPPEPSYRMNVISSNEERTSDVSFDEPSLDVLPV